MFREDPKMANGNTSVAVLGTGIMGAAMARNLLRAHFKTWYDRWIVSGKRMVFGSGSFVPALRSSASDTQVEVLKCALNPMCKLWSVRRYASVLVWL